MAVSANNGHKLEMTLKALSAQGMVSFAGLDFEERVKKQQKNIKTDLKAIKILHFAQKG